MKFVIILILSAQLAMALEKGADDYLAMASKVLGVSVADLNDKDSNSRILNQLQKDYSGLNEMLGGICRKADENKVELVLRYSQHNLFLAFKSYKNSRAYIFDVQLVFMPDGKLNTLHTQRRTYLVEQDPSQKNGVDYAVPSASIPEPEAKPTRP